MFKSPFPENYGFGVASLKSQGGYQPTEAESALLGERAGEARKIEFFLGRYAANLALRGLGFKDPIPSVLRGSGGEPLWPEGVIGSLSHTREWGVAVAVFSSQAHAIGIDIQEIRKLKYDISSRVCTKAEAQWLDTYNKEQRLELLTKLFSAKECAYKALYPIAKKFLGFHDVEFVLLEDKKTLLGTLNFGLDDMFQSGFQFSVKNETQGDVILSSLVI